jgi:TRAP-type C4-dicarboxylate transport system substrate-binding protein
MKRAIMCLIAVVLILMPLTACAAQSPAPSSKPSPAPVPQAQVIELKFGHQNPPNGRTTLKFLDPWVKKIEEAAKGKVKITTYPAESLFKGKEAIEASAGGIADIAWTQMSNYPGRFPLSSVLELPFLSLNEGKIDGKLRSAGAVNSRINQELYETLPEIQAEWKDIKLLFIHASEPRPIFTTKKQVKSMDDLKGLKIRELGGFPMEMLKLLGASPSGVPVPDLYESLDKGILDGATLPFAAMATYKLYEVTKYWTDVGTCSGEYFMIMNKDKFESLPADVKQAIMSVSSVAGAEYAGDTGWGNEVRDELMAMAEKAGKPMQRVELNPGEYEKWKEVAGKPVWDKWRADMSAKGLNGQKVLDATLSLLKKYSP